MGQKFKKWHNQERKPKKFRKLSSLGDGDFEFSDRREKQDRKDQKKQNWQRDWQRDWQQGQ